MSETLDSILSGSRETAPAPEPAPAVVSTEPKPDTQPRQPDGKFATKAAPEPTATPAPVTAPAPAVTPPAPQGQAVKPAEPQPGGVPPAALQAEREKRREKDAEIARLEGQLAQLTAMVSGMAPKPEPKPAAPPPDPFADPEGYSQHRISEALSPLQRQMEEQRHFFSRTIAETKFGEDTVQAALSAIAGAVNSDPEAAADYQRIMQSPSPYTALVQWHKKRATLTEIGEDPAAYKARIRAELLAEIQGNNGAQPAGTPAAPAAPAPVMPSNLSGARNVGNRSGPAWEGPKSLQDIFSRSKPGR